MSLPPYARRLDVRATRAAFSAGTLSTVRDDPASEHAQRDVETGYADGYDPHDVEHLPILTDRERERQAFLRRVQRIDPRERRA